MYKSTLIPSCMFLCGTATNVLWICRVKREKQVPCFAVETSRGVCFCFSSTRSIGLISGQTHVCSSPIIWRKIHIFGFFFSFTINYRNQPAFYSVFKQYMKIYQIYAGLQPNPSLMGTLNVHQYDEFSHLYNVYTIHQAKPHWLHFEKKVDNLGFGSTVNTLCRTVAHFYEALLQCSIYVEQWLLGMWNCEVCAGVCCGISLRRKLDFSAKKNDFPFVGSGFHQVILQAIQQIAFK